MTDPFRDRIALVTGAASGLGVAFCDAFVARGARLIMVDVHAERLAAEVARRGDAVVDSAVLDVSDRAAMTAFAERVLAQHGPPGILVNNAGVGHAGDIDETTLDDWDWVMDVNVRGVIYGCALFARHMRQAPGRAHIVNISSAAGLAGLSNSVAYATSKGAVLSLSESLANGPDPERLSAHVVCPGFVPSRIYEDGRGATATDKENMLKIAAKVNRSDRTAAAVAQATVRAIEKGRFKVVMHNEGRMQLMRRRLPDVIAVPMGRRAIARMTKKGELDEG